MRDRRALIVLATLLSATPSLATAGELTVHAYSTAGLPDRVHVRGRVFESGAASLVPKGEGRRADALHGNVRTFFTDEKEGLAVEVMVGEATLTLTTDDEGFFDGSLQPAGELTPGPHPYTATATHDGETAVGRGRVLVLPPGGGRLVVTDFDDTVVVTGVTSKREFLKNVFMKSSADLEPVEGMAGLYRCLRAGVSAHGPSRTSIHYFSASPVNLYPKVASFLSRHRFPFGPITLRDLEMKELSDSSRYKVEGIVALAERFPEHSLVLVGDSGERDPEVYRKVREALGERVDAILIRRVPGSDLTAARFDGIDLFDDGAAAAQVLATRKLIHPACAEYRSEAPQEAAGSSR